MSFAVPANLEAQLDELVTHYPQKRSASLMLLHALQEHFGYISRDAVEWTARKLGLQPINIYELVTFYPMFRQEPLGKTHIKVRRRPRRTGSSPSSSSSAWPTAATRPWCC